MDRSKILSFGRELNPLAYDKILELSMLKFYAVDKLNKGQMILLASKCEENVGK